MKKQNLYALYKGDTFLDIGTAVDLAKKYNVEPRTIKYYSMESYLKKSTKINNRLISVNLGSSDIDNDNNLNYNEEERS